MSLALNAVVVVSNGPSSTKDSNLVQYFSGLTFLIGRAPGNFENYITSNVISPIEDFLEYNTVGKLVECASIASAANVYVGAVGTSLSDLESIASQYGIDGAYAKSFVSGFRKCVSERLAGTPYCGGKIPVVCKNASLANAYDSFVRDLLDGGSSAKVEDKEGLLEILGQCEPQEDNRDHKKNLKFMHKFSQKSLKAGCGGELRSVLRSYKVVRALRSIRSNRLPIARSLAVSRSILQAVGEVSKLSLKTQRKLSENGAIDETKNQLLMGEFMATLSDYVQSVKTLSPYKRSVMDTAPNPNFNDAMAGSYSRRQLDTHVDSFILSELTKVLKQTVAVEQSIRRIPEALIPRWMNQILNSVDQKYRERIRVILTESVKQVRAAGILVAQPGEFEPRRPENDPEPDPEV